MGKKIKLIIQVEGVCFVHILAIKEFTATSLTLSRSADVDGKK